MTNRRKILAIIPARGGSKRLPRKNILPLSGKPLIHWTIEAALAAKAIDTVMVSTDSLEIAESAEECGARVPYIRKAELSNDTASSVDVVLDAIKFYEKAGQKFDYVLLLQPTSPLRTTHDINSAVDLLIETSAVGVVSVTECDHSPLWSNTLPETHSFDNFIDPKVASMRSQDLPTYYRLNGALYITDIDFLKKQKTLLPAKGAYSYVMPQNRSIDIDNELDFLKAEFVLTKRKKES